MNLLRKAIPGFEGLYEIDTKGNVYPMPFGEKKRKKSVLKNLLSSNGYFRVKLFDKNKKWKFYRVHRLVALTFIANDDPINKTVINHINKTVINHIDENKLNNDISNLEWTTQQDNIKKHYKIFPKPKKES